jgi:phage terminase Nu1 subunit (DNA packaging protein)
MPTTDKKLHKPVLDHNGKPYSPAQILALERTELTRVRRMDAEIDLAVRREKLIQTELVTRQAAAIFVACRQKLLAIPHTLSHRLVGKDHRTIHEALTGEIHKALREMADFSQKVVNPDWNPENDGDGDGARPPLLDSGQRVRSARVRKR